MLNPVILTWEYPPRVVGDLAYHVEKLTLGLSKARIPASVVTCHDSSFRFEKRSELLDIYWASNPVESHISVITWCLTLNSEVERITSNIFYERADRIDLLDIHDWHFVSAGASIKRALGIPFIFTIHSLEGQRSPDSSTPLSSCISGLESLGVVESDLVIAKTEPMKEEIVKSCPIPSTKVVIINTTDPSWVREVVKLYRRVKTRARE
jgi:hypothetical protein